MKKHLLISLFVLHYAFATAQAYIYHPLPDSNAVWIYGSYDSQCTGPYNLCPYRYYIVQGDTVIGNHSYKKVFSSSDGITYNYYEGAFRQDLIARKVYANIPYKCGSFSVNGIDTLLYDFNQQAGDTLKQCIDIVGGSGPYIISSVDSVLIAGSWHRRINILNSYFTSLIEGIGSTSGFFCAWDGWIGGNCFLACFSLNNGISVFPDTTCNLYTGINFNNNFSTIDFKVFPNPISNIGTININIHKATNGKFILYDLLRGSCKTVFLGKLNIGNNDIDFDSSCFTSGLYILQFMDEKDVSMNKKLIEIIH